MAGFAPGNLSYLLALNFVYFSRSTYFHPILLFEGTNILSGLDTRVTSSLISVAKSGEMLDNDKGFAADALRTDYGL